MAEGLRSFEAISNIGVGAFTWICILEPLWHKFKDPIAQNEARKIIEDLHQMFTNPSMAVYDDMINIGKYLGGQSEKEISEKVVQDWFSVYNISFSMIK